MPVRRSPAGAAWTLGGRIHTKRGLTVQEKDGFYIGLMLEEIAAEHPAASVTLDIPLQLAPQEGTTVGVVRLAGLVREVAGRLLAAGVARGQYVVVYKSNNFDIALLAMAVQRIGAVPVLLSPMLDGEAGRSLIARVDDPWLLTDRQTFDSRELHGVAARVLIVDGEAPANTTPLADCPVRPLTGVTVSAPDKPAFISHTSGTTGLPKLAAQSPAVLWRRLRWQKEYSDRLWRDEPVALCISVVHVRFYSALYLALSYGNPLLVAVDDSPAVIGPLFAAHRPGVVETQPNSFVDWELLADAPDQPLANVSCYHATFDAVHPRTIQILLGSSKRRNPRLLQMYGQTETAAVATRWFTMDDLEDLDARCVGRELPGLTRIRVVDDAGVEVGPGTAGHIEVSSQTFADTYVGEEARFAAQLHDGWWRMGDIGYLDEGGSLHLLDREIDQVESVDSNLEIEDALMERLPELREIVVVPGAGSKPVPVVCTRDDSPLDARRWQEATADLAELAELVQLPFERLPLTATRKVQRHALIRLLARREDELAPRPAAAVS